MLNKEVILGILRHILTIAGGYLVATGKLDPESSTTIIGSLTALAGIGLSIKHKVE